jgi:hypothetical protein
LKDFNKGNRLPQEPLSTSERLGAKRNSPGSFLSPFVTARRLDLRSGSPGAQFQDPTAYGKSFGRRRGFDLAVQRSWKSRLHDDPVANRKLWIAAGPTSLARLSWFHCPVSPSSPLR